MRLLACVVAALALHAEELPRFATPTKPNEAPTISYAGPAAAVAEGARVDLHIDVNDADAAEDYAGQLEVTCTGGALAVASRAGLKFRNVSDGVAFRGAPDLVQAALRPLTYAAPSAGRGGAAAVTCVVDDLGYSGSGGPRNATLVVPVTIMNVNDAPVIAAPDMLAVEGEHALPVTVSDADGGSLTLTLRASHGMLQWAAGAPAPVLEASGPVEKLAEKLRGLTYDPSSYHGLATVSIVADDRAAQTTKTIALRVAKSMTQPILSLNATRARRGVPTRVLHASITGDADTVLQVRVVAETGELTLPEAPPGAFVRTRNGREVAFDAGPAFVGTTLDALTYQGDAGAITVRIGDDETSIHVELEEEVIALVRDAPLVVARLKMDGAIKTDEDVNTTFALLLLASDGIHEVEVRGNSLGVVDFGRPGDALVHKRTRNGVWIRGNSTMVNAVLASLVFAPSLNEHGAAYVDVTLDGARGTPVPCFIKAVEDPLRLTWGASASDAFLPPLIIEDVDESDGLFEVLLQGMVEAPVVPGVHLTKTSKGLVLRGGLERLPLDRLTGSGPVEATVSIGRRSASVSLEARNATLLNTAHAFDDSSEAVAEGLEDEDIKMALRLKAGGDPLLGLEVVLSAGVGSFNVEGTIDGVDVIRGASLTLRASAADLNRGLEALRYVPPSDWHGTDLINATLKDLGGHYISVRSLLVTIAAVDDAPRLTASVLHAATLSVRLEDALSVEDVDDDGLMRVVLHARLGALTLKRPALAGVTLEAGDGLILLGAADRISEALRRVDYAYPALGAEDDRIAVRAVDVDSKLDEGLVATAEVRVTRPARTNARPSIKVERSSITTKEGARVPLPRCQVSDPEAAASEQAVHVVLHATQLDARFSVARTEGVAALEVANVLRLTGTPILLEKALETVSVAYPAHWCGADVVTYAAADGDGLRAVNATVAVAVQAVNDAPAVTLHATDAVVRVGDSAVIGATFADADVNGCGDATIAARYAVVPSEAAALNVDARGLAVQVAYDEDGVVVTGLPQSLSAVRVAAVPSREGRFVVEVAAADGASAAKTQRFVVTANRAAPRPAALIEATPAFAGSLNDTFAVAPGTLVYLEASLGTFSGPGARGAAAASTDLGSLAYVPPDRTGVALLRASLDRTSWVESVVKYELSARAPLSIEATVASVTARVGVAVGLNFTLRGGLGFVEVRLAGDGAFRVANTAGARVDANTTRIAGAPSAVAAALATLTYAPRRAGASQVSAAVGASQTFIDVDAEAPPPTLRATHDGFMSLEEDTPLNVTKLFDLVDAGYELPVAVKVTALFGAIRNEKIVQGTVATVQQLLARLEYVPPRDFVGVDELEATLALTEGSWGKAARMVLQVTAINDAPTVARAAEVTVAAGAGPVALKVEVADADRDDALEAVVVAAKGTVALPRHAAVAAGATVLEGNDTAWTSQCGGGALDGAVYVQIAGDAARVDRALRSLTYAPPQDQGEDRVAVTVRDGAGLCASSAVNVHVTDAAAAAMTVEGDALEVLEDATTPLPPLRLRGGGGGAVNVSLEASCGGAFALDDAKDLRVWARGPTLGFEVADRGTAEAALGRVAFAPPPNFHGGWGVQSFPEALSEDVKRFCRSLREEPPSLAISVNAVGAGWTTKRLRLDVLPRNDPPRIIVDGTAHALAAQADEAAPWSRVGSGISVSDADAGLLDVRVVAATGALRLSSAATGVEITKTPPNEVRVRGPPADVERALQNALEFRPVKPGVAFLNLTARDGGGCGAGPEGIAEARLTVRAGAPSVGLAWAPGPLRASTTGVVSVAPTLYANGSVVTDEESGSLQLEVLATNGRVALGEDHVRFREPAAAFRLDVESGPAARMEGTAEVWSVSTQTDYRYGRQRLRVEADTRDDPVTALRTIALRVGLTHRNRSSAAFFELGGSAEEARANFLDAVGEVATLGRVEVTVEAFGGSRPGTAEAVFEVITYQNEPLPLLSLDVDRCGPTVEDGTLVAGAAAPAACRTHVAHIQPATTAPDVQRISIRANHTFEAGTFTLTHRSPTNRDLETRPLPYNATIYELRDALEQLPGVGLVDVRRLAQNARVEVLDYWWCTARDNTPSPTGTQAPTFNTLEPSSKLSLKPSSSQSPTYRTLEPTPGPSQTPTSLPSQVPTLLPTEPDVDCDFYAVENAWEVTFWTASGRAPLLVVKHAGGASEEGYAACPACPYDDTRYTNVTLTNTLCCRPLRPAWNARIAAEAGVDRAVVAATQEATVHLEGELALRWGDRTTTFVSAARATAGHVKSALEALDPSIKGGIKVDRGATSAEGATTYALTFASRFGALEPLTIDEGRLVGARAAARLDARGRAPRNVGVYSLRVSQNGFAATTAPIAASASPADLEAALVNAADAAGLESFAATVQVAKKVRAATVASYEVRIAGGAGDRPEVAVESVRGLQAGVDVLLTVAGARPRRAYAVQVEVMPPVTITEVQLLKCARSHADHRDETFTLRFQGLESPPITLGAAPTPSGLPACPQLAGACRGDGSSLLEILQGWLLREGVIADAHGILVEGGSSLCAEPVNCMTEPCTKAQKATLYGGWGLGLGAETRIRVPGLPGDVEPFVPVTKHTRLAPWQAGRGLTNGTFINMEEELKGLAPLVAEVQTVETSPYANRSRAAADPVHGVFRLGFRGAFTAPLPHDASARAVEAALNALPTISRVAVTRVATLHGHRWRVTFDAGGGDLPPLETPSATCGNGGDEECHLRVGESVSSVVQPPYGRPAAVTVTEVRRGAAPAWGSFRLRATPPFPVAPRRGGASADLRVDASIEIMRAALRRLPGCAAATVSLKNASYWVVDGLDDGVALAVDAVQLKSSVDCAACADSAWPGCAHCIEPTIRVRRLVAHAVVTGAPRAVAAVLARATYVPGVASVDGGLGRVAYEVTSGNVSSRVEGRVFVEAAATPPALAAPSVIFADEGRRSSISGVTTSGTRVTFEADGGILSIGQVRGVAVAEDGPRLAVSGPAAKVTAALATLTYEAPPAYQSNLLEKEVQVVRAYAPPALYIFAVRTTATGNALVDGTFTLRLACDYLVDDLAEAIVAHAGTRNGSRFDAFHANASLGLAGVYNRVERRLANRTVDIVIDALAAARGAGAARDAGGAAEDIRRGVEGAKHNASFEGKIRDALDACARDALAVAGAQGDFDNWIVAKPNVTRFFGHVLGVSVQRSEMENDGGCEWEVTVAGAPPTFRAPRVVRDSSGPVGLTVKRKINEVANCTRGQCFDLAMGADAASDVTVRTTKRSVATVSEMTLAFEGVSTEPLRADASASVVEAALLKLATIRGVRVAKDEDGGRYGWSRDWRRDGCRAWAVEFDHLGPQPLLIATAAGGAEIVVSRKRVGKATARRITARVEGGNAETIEVVVRPKVQAPRLRLAAKDAGVVSAREDEVVAGVFGGVALEAAGVIKVEAACERGPCAFLVPTHDGVATALGVNRLNLRGLAKAVQQVLRNTSIVPGADVDGVDVAVLSVVGGNTVTRAFLLAAVDDAPSVDAGPLGTHLELPRRRVLLNGFVVDDVDDDALSLTLAAARGTLTMARAARRTLARWRAGDTDGQHASLQARGAVGAWNAALSYVEYEPPADETSDVITLTVSDATASTVKTVSISITGAASCATRMVLRARRAFAKVVRPDVVKAALEAEVVTEGAVVPLDFSVDAPCGRNARFVAVVAPLGGVVRLADAVDASFASFEALATGAQRVEAPTVGAIEQALALLVYQPPRDTNGMVALKVAVEATGGDATGVLEAEVWFRVAARDDAPTVSVDVFDGTLTVDAVVARAGVHAHVVAAEAASRTGAAFGRGAWTIEDESAFVSVSVEVTGDADLFLSVEEGCRRDACGALHFGNGTRGGARPSFSFAATSKDAMAALDALRVVAVADDCWRARDDASAADKALPGVLTVVVEDAGGQRAERTVAISAQPPQPGALSVAASGGVVDVAEDGRALISGVDVAGGAGTVDGCGVDEVLEVQISARSGRIGSVGDVVGVVVDRVGGALRLRGPRKAIRGILSSVTT